MKKKLISITLIVSLLVTMMPLMAFAKTGKTLNYVSLGASNSNGYALHGYFDEAFYSNPQGISLHNPMSSGYKKAPEGCYPDLIRDYYEKKGYTVELSQLAQSSMRVEELRFLLDENYAQDEYTKWRFYEEGKDNWFGKTSEDLAKIRGEYKRAIQQADLITYDFGLNNFGVYIINQLSDNLFGNDFSYIFPEKYTEMFYSLRDALEKQIVGTKIVDKETLKTVDNVVDTLAYALLGYCVNFDATIKDIHKLNPKAQVMVLGIQNLLDGTKIKIKGISIPVDKIYGAFVNLANNYMKKTSPYKKYYHYVGVKHVSTFYDQLKAYDGNLSSIDQDMKDCLDVYDASFYSGVRFRIAAMMACELAKEVQGATVSFTYNEKSYSFNKNELYNYRLDHDNNHYINSIKSVTAYLKLQGKYEAYLAACNEAYVQIYNILHGVTKESAISADFFLDGNSIDDVGGALRDFESLIINVTLGIGQAYANGAEYVMSDDDKQLLKKFTTEPLSIAGAIFSIRSQLGNTFFSHPNRDGHKQVANAVIKAVKLNKVEAIVSVPVKVAKVVSFINTITSPLKVKQQNQLKFLNTFFGWK